MAAPDAPVLIVGAGPAGLILAHELLRRGIAVRVLEKRPGLVRPDLYVGLNAALADAGCLPTFLDQWYRPVPLGDAAS